MSLTEKYRTLNQDDWKRTQLRMPQKLYKDIAIYANDNNMSLNTAMIDLISKSLTKTDSQTIQTIEILEALAIAKDEIIDNIKKASL